MGTPWFKGRPELLDEIQEAVSSRYPELRVCCEAEVILLRGTFSILYEGEVLDRYKIEVSFPPDHPRALPRVREVGGRIPWTVDRHVYPSSGIACVVVDEDWLLATGGIVSFVEFMEGPVRNFFLGQSLVELGRPWPFGERSHGVKGLIETYGEWFGNEDEAAVLKYLEYLGKKKVKGHWPCPCGSGYAVRGCHAEQVRALQDRIPRWLATRALGRLTFARNVRDQQRGSGRDWPPQAAGAIEVSSK